MSPARGTRSDAQRWDEMARHLVQAHGGNAVALIRSGPTLDGLYFAHADTHVALALIYALPPDGHAHPPTADAGWFFAGLESEPYRPFRHTSHEQDTPRVAGGTGFPQPSQTGLPHTGAHPRNAAEIADWIAGRIPGRLASPFDVQDWAAIAHTWQAEGTAATRAGWIRASAERASAAWAARDRRVAAALARSSFPAPVQAGPSVALASPGAGPGRRSPSHRTSRRGQ